MAVEKKTRFNLTCLLIALWGVLLSQGFIAARFRPKETPYSAFLKALLEVEVLHAEEFERLAGCGEVPGPAGEAA